MAGIGNLVVHLGMNTSGFISGASTASSALGRFSAGILSSLNPLRMMSGMLSAVGVGFSAFAAIGVVRRVDGFNAAMNRSLAILPGVSAEMRSSMAETARFIGLQEGLKVSATEAAESFRFLIAAGKSAEQSQRMLGDVLTFAQAGMFDAALATDLLTDAQSALRLTSKDLITDQMNLRRVSDVLVKGNTLFNASVQQLSESITNKAGASAAAFKIEVEELTAVLGVFADQGIKGADGGTAFGIVMRDLTTKAITNAGAFRALNIEVFNAEGNLRPIADVVEDLTRTLDPMSVEMRKATLMTLGFSDKSVAFAQALLGSQEQIRRYKTELEAAGGTTKEVAESQLTPMEKAIAKVNQVFDILIQDALPGLISSLADSVSGFIQNRESMEALGGTIGFIGDLIQGMRIMLGAAQVAWNMLGVAAAETAYGIVRAAEIVTGSGNELSSAIARDADAAIANLQSNQDKLGKLIDSPLTSESMRDRFGSIADAISAFSAKEAVGIGAVLSAAIGGGVEEGIDSVADDVTKALDNLNSGAESKAEQFANSIRNKMKTPLEELNETIDKIRDAVEFGKLTPEEADDAIKFVMDEFLDKQEAQLKSFADGLTKSMETPFEKFTAKRSKIEDAFNAGLISLETFQRAMIANQEELAKAEKDTAERAETDADKAVGALQKGSSEAFSAIMASIRGETDKAEMETAKNTKAVADNTKKQAETMARIERSLDFNVVGSFV